MNIVNRWVIIAAAAAVVGLTGCSTKDQKSSQPPASGTETTSPATGQEAKLPADVKTESLAVSTEAPPAQTKPPATQKPKPPTKKDAPPSQETEKKPPVVAKTASVPAGTAISVELVTPLRTDSNQVGDLFTARVAEAIIVEGATVVPAGSEMRGRLTEVEEPHRTKGKARMTLQIESIVDASGTAHSITASPIVLEGEGDKISDEAKVGGGAVVGGIVGALTSKKKGKGAAVGAAVGAAAGGAAALATKGKQIELPAGHALKVEVTQTAELPAP
ncbi:MAG: hypothetical protein AB1792_06300 [Candidatus Zixiibacteriota bacterium]